MAFYLLEQRRHATIQRLISYALALINFRTFEQGWCQEFSDGGLTLPMRGLKYGFQGTINAKNIRKNRFSSSEGG